MFNILFSVLIASAQAIPPPPIPVWTVFTTLNGAPPSGPVHTDYSVINNSLSDVRSVLGGGGTEECKRC